MLKTYRSPSNLSPRELNISEDLSTPPGVNGTSSDSNATVDVRLLGSRSYEFIDMSSCFLYPQLDVTTRIQARQQIVLLQVISFNNTKSGDQQTNLYCAITNFGPIYNFLL